MIFAAFEYPEAYEDMHDGLVAFVKARFSRVEFGLQGDSWIWIFLGADKVEIDTFSSMKHWIKASRPGSHVDAVIEALRGAYTIRIYSAPELEPHEPDPNEERA